MLKRTSRIAVTALCSLAVGLLTLSATHAAGTTLIEGKGNKNVIAVVWLDGASGATLDDKTAKTMLTQYADTEWALQDDGRMTIGKGGKTLYTVQWISNKDMSVIPLHGRTGKTVVDGTIYRDPKNLSEGFAVFFVNQTSTDGKSTRCLRIEVEITFDSEGGPPQPPVDGEGF